MTDGDYQLTSDLPIAATVENPFAQDDFHFEPAVRNLCQITRQLNPPFTFGIYGSWGTGKTSFMRMMSAYLANHDVKTFFFEAWKYEDEQRLILPLISKLAESKAEANPEIVDKAKKIQEILLVSIMGALDSAVDAMANNALSVERPTNKPRWSELYDEKTANLVYEWTSVIDQFSEACDDFMSDIIADKDRVVIFIDDLDRCSPLKVVRFLEDIKHFLLTDKCVFVVAADKDVIIKAIDTKYGDELGSGSDYLEKIVNLHFEIQSPKVASIRMFVTSILEGLTPEGFVTKHAERIEALSTILSDVDIKSPRKIRKLVVRFALFLMTDNSERYSIDVVVMALIVREYYPDLYRQKQATNNICFFPAPHTISNVHQQVSLTYDDIVEKYSADIAELVYTNTKLLQFLLTIHSTIQIDELDGHHAQAVSRWRDLIRRGSDSTTREIQPMQGDMVTDSASYFTLLDYLFSLQG